MQCPSRAIPWYSSFSTSQGRRTFRSIPSSAALTSRPVTRFSLVYVHEAQSSLVNVSHWPFRDLRRCPPFRRRRATSTHPANGPKPRGDPRSFVIRRRSILSRRLALFRGRVLRPPSGGPQPRADLAPSLSARAWPWDVREWSKCMDRPGLGDV